MAYFSSLPGTTKERKRERERKGKRERINEERDENNKAKGPRREDRGEGGRISSVERRRDGEKVEVEGGWERVKGRIKWERKEGAMHGRVSGIELSTQTRDGYYVERVITTACEGVFKDVVRAREIETLLAGFNGAAARGFSSSPNELQP